MEVEHFNARGAWHGLALQRVAVVRRESRAEAFGDLCAEWDAAWVIPGQILLFADPARPPVVAPKVRRITVLLG